MIIAYSWPFFAILSAFLWTIVSLSDKISVKAIFSSPSQGMLVSSIFSVPGLLSFLFVGTGDLTIATIIFGIFGGILVQISQLAYFFAMKDEEVGDLTALAAAYPLVVAVLAILVGKSMTSFQWAGVFLVMLALLIIRWKKVSPKAKVTIPFVFAYVIFLALSSIVVNLQLDHSLFVTFFPFYCTGLVVGGLMPFFNQNQRKLAIQAFPTIKRFALPLLCIEIVNVAALGCEVFALSKGHPALVASLSSTEPAFAFVISNFLSRRSNFQAFFEPVNGLKYKLLGVVLLSLGLGILGFT